VRRVRREGAIKWRGQAVFISEALSGELLGIRELPWGDYLVRFANLSWASSGQENRACAAAGRTPAYTLMSLSFSLNCPRSIRSDLSSMFPVAQPIDPTHALPQNLKGRALESADPHSPPKLRWRESNAPLGPQERR
jgi:hypothetical protein